MNLPCFTAEASLYPSSRSYYWAVNPGHSGGSIRPAAYAANNRCGCMDTYIDCSNACLRQDPTCGIVPWCPCQQDCWTFFGDCQANCSRRLLTVPPGVVRLLGR